MLKILVEIWPFGDESMKRTLGEAVIINLGTNEHAGLADYSIAFYEDGQLYKKEHIKDYHRDKGFWELIKKGLE